MPSAKKYTPRPRTQPLGRGKACLNCRHLKIKCNGTKPVCDQCQRVEKDDPCEYSDYPSRTQQLLEAVNQLQTRVLELESQRGVRDHTACYDSFDRYTPPIKRSERSERAGSYSGSDSASPSPSNYIHVPASFSPSDSGSEGSSVTMSSSSGLPSSSSSLGLEDPPYSVVQMLFCNFFPHAQELGFFRHIGRFRYAFQSFPFGDPSRPSPSLLNAIYLWGAHFSDRALFVGSIDSEEFLRRAVYYASTGVLSNGMTTTQLLDVVQTHVLLANYFLSQNQSFKAEFHANSATSLVLAYGFHKVRTPNPVLGLPVDAVEEGEKINAFWTVYCLRKLMSSLSGKSSSVFGTLETPELDIDTPWPWDIEAYETQTGSTAHPHQGSSTITVFLVSGTDDGDQAFGPTKASFTKAFILFHETTLLADKRSDYSIEQLDVYRRTCACLNDRIVNFRYALSSRCNTPSSQACNISYALLAAGSMVLHHIFSPSNKECRRKCLIAAQSTLHLLNSLLSDSTPNPASNFIDPTVVLLFSETCRVLLEENALSSTRHNGDMGVPFVEKNATQTEPRNGFQGSLSNAISTLAYMAGRSPLMDYHFQKIRHSSENTYPFLQ